MILYGRAHLHFLARLNEISIFCCWKASWQIVRVSSVTIFGDWRDDSQQNSAAKCKSENIAYIPLTAGWQRH